MNTYFLKKWKQSFEFGKKNNIKCIMVCERGLKEQSDYFIIPIEYKKNNKTQILQDYLKVFQTKKYFQKYENNKIHIQLMQQYYFIENFISSQEASLIYYIPDYLYKSYSQFTYLQHNVRGGGADDYFMTNYCKDVYLTDKKIDNKKLLKQFEKFLNKYDSMKNIYQTNDAQIVIEVYFSLLKYPDYNIKEKDFSQNIKKKVLNYALISATTPDQYIEYMNKRNLMEQYEQAHEWISIYYYLLKRFQ